MTANPLSSIPPIGPTTGFGGPQPSGRFKPIDPLRVVRQYIWWLIGAGLVGIVIGVLVFVVLLKFSPKWQSKAQLRLVSAPQTGWDTGAGDQSQQKMDLIEPVIKAEVMRVKSQEIIDEALLLPIVRDTAWFQKFSTPAAARESLQEDLLGAGMVRDAPLMTLSVATRRKDDAQRILSGVMEVYLEKLKRDVSEDVRERSVLFTDERQEALTNIDRVEERIRIFTEQHSLTSLDASRSEIALELQGLTRSRMELNLELQSAIAGYDTLKRLEESGELNASAEDSLIVEMTPRIERMNQDILAVKQERAVLLDRFGPKHPAVEQMDRRITAIETEKKIEVDKMLRERQAMKIEQASNAVEGLRAQLAAMEPRIAETTARMLDVTKTLAQYDQLQNELQYFRDVRKRAEDTLRELSLMSRNADAVRFKVQASATEPERIFPKVQVVVPGVTILVLGAVTGLVFLKELMDQSVKSPVDVKMLADAELLGVLPDADEDPSGTVPVECVVEKHPTGLMAESFRQVRTALLGKMDRRGYKTLLLAGGQPQSGTTSVAHNLATSLAFNGRKVLLLDANFRRPGLHKLVGTDNDKGLVDVLRDRAVVGDVITQVEGSSLYLLPAGNSAEAAPELLEGQAFRSMLSQLEAEFDMVLIDCAPSLLASDARLLAKHVDAIAVIVRAGADKRGMVERMLRQLDGHRADVLGVVLNRVRSSAGGYFRKSYQDFYEYRQGSGASNGSAARGARRSQRLEIDETITN